MVKMKEISAVSKLSALVALSLILIFGNLFVGLAGQPAPTNLQNSPAEQRGIYVYSWDIATRDFPMANGASQLVQALNVPGVDGITLVESWNTIEPDMGVYEWTQPGPNLLDQWIKHAISSGKKINLAIRAGRFTPCWLLQAPQCGPGYTKPYAGASPLIFKASAHQGAGTCLPVNIAAPWDPIFLSQWDAMLAAVSQHLKDQGTYDAITTVRLTGINRTTDELRLPEEILPAPCETNSIDTWLGANYRPANLFSAWDAITDSFQRSFPDKFFNVAIIPIDTGQAANPSFPFPEIDDNGCIYVPPVSTNDVNACVSQFAVPDQNQPLIELASRKFSGRLLVEFENLDLNKSASSTVVQYAETLGTATGFMTNNYFGQETGGAACSGGFLHPMSCSAPDYFTLVETGIYPCRTNSQLCGLNSFRSQFIEVLPPDVIPPECSSSYPVIPTTCGYSAEIWQAHVELVDYTPPVITATASPAELWPPRGQMVQVTVSGTMTDDLSGVSPGTAQFVVEDEYGAIQPTGAVTLGANGAYSFLVALAARRDGQDTLGRQYTIVLSVKDKAGNTGSASTTVLVPHDQGRSL